MPATDRPDPGGCSDRVETWLGCGLCLAVLVSMFICMGLTLMVGGPQ
jgi:hypothetical protein